MKDLQPWRIRNLWFEKQCRSSWVVPSKSVEMKRPVFSYRAEYAFKESLGFRIEPCDGCREERKDGN